MHPKFILVFFLFASVLSSGIAQTYDDLYKKGLKYISEFKYIEGLATFQVLLKTDSNRLEYLTNASVLYAKQGNMQADEKGKQDYFHIAEYLAKKAISLNRNSAEAHYGYALALGRLNENASSKQKIANAKLIKTEAEDAIRINPQMAGAYHILGRWHRTIAGFNAIEKFAINTMFGGMPQGGSYEAAIDAFRNAIKYEPNYILHYYELAETYHERDSGPADKQEMRTLLRKAMDMPSVTPEDPETKKKCGDLLNKIGG